MRMTLVLVSSLTAACATDDSPSTTDSEDTEVKIKPDDLLEPSYVNGVQCQIVFQGALSEDTQYYAIWAVGTHGIVDAPYDTEERPNLYAIFGTSRPEFETHHVDGYDQFDHYHVAENDLHGHHGHHGHKKKVKVHNREWDVLTLWPGPNFDPATYTSAKTVEELMAQSQAGILSEVLPLPAVGFPEFVLHAPIVCPK